MSGNEDGEKEHEPTQKKLDDARRRGEVAKSGDLSVAAAYGGLIVATTVTGEYMLATFGEWGVAILERSTTLIPNPHSADGAVSWGIVASGLAPALVFFLIPSVLVIAALTAQRAWVIAPNKIAPRLSRIDPVTNAKQKFGPDGLFEFAKSTVKLMAISAALGLFLADRMPRMLVIQGNDPGLITQELMNLIIDFLVLIFLIAVIFGAVDYLWQRHSHLHRNRMTRQELLDEIKQSDGDPHVRGRRRQRAEAIATNRMLADVPNSDVILINPTHYAVALRWDRNSGRAPICVAKGVDSVAMRIRETAIIAGVPIRSDPVAARALHASVDVGREILPVHYAPVAAAIRFAEKMRRRARRNQGK